MALYRCASCKQTLRRSSTKQWIAAFCHYTWVYTRFVRVKT